MWLCCLLLLTFLRPVLGGDGQFYNPPPSATTTTGYLQQDLVWTAGDIQTINFTTTVTSYTIALWQQFLNGSLAQGPVIFRMPLSLTDYWRGPISDAARISQRPRQVISPTLIGASRRTVLIWMNLICSSFGSILAMRPSKGLRPEPPSPPIISTSPEQFQTARHLARVVEALIPVRLLSRSRARARPQPKARARRPRLVPSHQQT